MSTSTVPYQQNPYGSGGSSTVIQCYRCGDTCKGEVVRVQSNHFHIRCFTCQVCGCDLAQSGFFFKNGEYICTHDYQQLYGTRCDSCHDFITGEVISALGRTYHPKCFVCSMCRKPFPIGDKVTFSGKDCVCQACSHSLISSKPIKIHGPSHCAGCKEEIKHGQSLLALEKQWHVSCFKCQTCGIILTGEYISKDSVPYCESDYHAQFGIKCETCDRYISGRVLEAGGKHYHPTCARCVRCHQMFTEGEEMYLTGSEVWHPICKQAARAEKKLKHRRTSETSISPPGSSIGSPNRVICAKVDNEILNYKDLAALPKIKAIYEVQRPDLISYEPYHRYTSDETLERYSYGESLGTLSPYSQDIYESIDIRQRRASSPGYIDSPTYSRQGMSPTIPRSPHHYYRSGTESGRSSPYYSQLDVRSSTPTSYQAPKHFHIPGPGAPFPQSLLGLPDGCSPPAGTPGGHQLPERVTSTGNHPSINDTTIHRQLRKAKPAKTLHSPPNTAQPTPRTHTTTPSPSTGLSKVHPKYHEPADSHQGEKRTDLTGGCTKSRAASAG
ncbi:actin-binding LIM protein 3 isoform X6 [Gopherus evgoodei]|uniref:actin-binding LIM protein 3 isoform X6 n=1 Tax=Gopherus evgoodei TaxID=1825980 RepID=UPI0011D03490|nr:actin-binding LIM protein 3 isoform X6 [Gopherus evgoodei]